jgi:NADP-reducing hydrogenase subunit HndD
MLGAVMKTYFAQKHGLDPKDIFVVSVMPCTAKKFEAKREELRESGFPDVDAVITTRELAKMIKQASIDFNKLPDEDFDEVFGESTGASVIFGVTGGVMEAALRTVSEVVTNKPLEKIEFNEVRGLEGIKEAEITLGDKNIKIAVANSTGCANKLLEKVKSGEKEYHFIEIMGCPGGCINGGGQPFVSDKTKTEEDVLGKRANALYEEDESKTIRKSHENPHTHYVKRPKYTE